MFKRDKHIGHQRRVGPQIDRVLSSAVLVPNNPVTVQSSETRHSASSTT